MKDVSSDTVLTMDLTSAASSLIRIPVLLGVLVAACSGKGASPTSTPCTDPNASNAGRSEQCRYPFGTVVTLTNVVYHRLRVTNPFGTAADQPVALRINDTSILAEFQDARWNRDTQDWTIAAIDMVPVGSVNQLSISDGARGIFIDQVPTVGSEIVCADVSINGRMLKPTSEAPRERCYFKTDSTGNITSTDAAGNPK